MTIKTDIVCFKEKNSHGHSSDSQMQNIIYNWNRAIEYEPAESLVSHKMTNREKVSNFETKKNFDQKITNKKSLSKTRFNHDDGNHAAMDSENEFEKSERFKSERFLFFSQKDTRIDYITFDDIIKPYETDINQLFEQAITSSLMSIELIQMVNYNNYLMDEFIENSNYKYKENPAKHSKYELFLRPNTKTECYIESEQTSYHFVQKSVYSYNYIEIDDILKRILFKPIQLQSDLVNKCLVNYFLFDLNLEEHLEVLRKYFLFENGDFAQFFVDQLVESLFSLDLFGNEIVTSQ